MANKYPTPAVDLPASIEVPAGWRAISFSR